MPRNIESGLSEDNTPEYRTAKGDKGLIFTEPGKTADKIENQEKVAHSKELRIEDIKVGSSAMVWYNIDKDAQRQLQLMDEGKPYNKQLLEDLMSERSILQSQAEQNIDVQERNAFVENDGNTTDYWRVNLKETPAGKMIPRVEKDLLFLESKDSLSKEEQDEMNARKRVIEKLGRESLKAE